MVSGHKAQCPNYRNDQTLPFCGYCKWLCLLCPLQFLWCFILPALWVRFTPLIHLRITPISWMTVQGQVLLPQTLFQSTECQSCSYKSLSALLTGTSRDTPFHMCCSLPGRSNRFVHLQTCSWWSWLESQDMKQGHGSKVVTIKNAPEPTVMFSGVLQTGG